MTINAFFAVAYSEHLSQNNESANVPCFLASALHNPSITLHIGLTGRALEDPLALVRGPDSTYAPPEVLAALGLHLPAPPVRAVMFWHDLLSGIAGRGEYVGARAR